MKLSPFLVFFYLLSLLSRSTAAPSHVALANKILYDSGFVSMSVRLEVIVQSLDPTSPWLTIFAPPESAFKSMGQPSLSILQFHFTQLRLPLQTMRSLPAGTKIPTLLADHSLVITEPPSDSEISLNNVTVATGSPIYDDGFLVILRTECFFDPNYSQTPVVVPRTLQSVNGSNTMGASLLEEVEGVLACNGYAKMGSFLELQLLELKQPSRLTVFAPLDQSMDQYPILQDASFFLRHMVPTRLTITEMLNFSEGLVLETYVEDFNITISRSGNVFLINQVPVYKANLFCSEFLVVHGLKDPLQITGSALHQEHKRVLVVLGHSLATNNSTPASVMVLTTTQPINAGLSRMKLIGILIAIVAFLVGLLFSFHKWVFKQTVQVTMDTAIDAVGYAVTRIYGALSAPVLAGVAAVVTTLGFGMAHAEHIPETSTIQMTQMTSTMNEGDIENQQPEHYINRSNMISFMAGGLFAGVAIFSIGGARGT